MWSFSGSFTPGKWVDYKLVVESQRDLLVESLSAGEYVSESQTVLTDSPQFAATGEYDLRPLGVDLADYGDGDDLLADILAESELVGLV